jgi:RNA polymerase sigma-B factor
VSRSSIRSARDEMPCHGQAYAPSGYADQMPKLRALAALPAADPRRGLLREELILAFLPVVAHLARRHARGVTASVEELTQVTVTVGRAGGPLSQELGRAPRPSELAARVGAAVEEVIDALAAQASHYAGALDLVDPPTGLPLLERLGALDDELEQVEYHHALRPLLDALPERERMILVLRFFGELTQTQIAQRLGISQMHVSRLLSRTLKQLRVQLIDPADVG